MSDPPSQSISEIKLLITLSIRVIKLSSCDYDLLGKLINFLSTTHSIYTLTAFQESGEERV